MSRDRYVALREWFLCHQRALKVLKTAYTVLPAVVFVLYPVMIIIKAVLGFDAELLKMILVPAGVFAGVTVLRKLIGRTRPYDKYGVTPLIQKDDNHSSMPSRHAASAFIIAMSGFVLAVPLGISLLCMAALIAATRVLAGVHFISDVVCGMLISVIVGIVFFIIL